MSTHQPPTGLFWRASDFYRLCMDRHRFLCDVKTVVQDILLAVLLIGGLWLLSYVIHLTPLPTARTGLLEEIHWYTSLILFVVFPVLSTVEIIKRRIIGWFQFAATPSVVSVPVDIDVVAAKSPKQGRVASHLPAHNDGHATASKDIH